MIAGIGVDIVEVAKIKQKAESASGFMDYVFSAQEIAACEQKSNRYESLAARFAAKEAFLKALGTGIPFSFELNQLEVRNNEAGKPFFVFSETIKQILIELIGSIPDIQLSMSHTSQQAIAFVIFNRI